MNIFQHIKADLRRGDTTLWLVTVNTVIFLLYWLLRLFSVDILDRVLPLPSSPAEALLMPWTAFTYMFTHFNLLHLVCNMLWLWWFGRHFDPWLSRRRLLALYISGGLAGAAIYLLAGGLGWIPAGTLVGASASVMCLMAATALSHPSQKINLLFIGEIKLIWIAAVCVALSFLGLGGGNSGGQIAHLGGLLTGALFVLASLYRQRRSKAPPHRPTPEKNPRREGRNTVGRRMHAPRIAPEVSARIRLDQLLDKIRVSGYESLSRAERDELKSLSSRIDTDKP